MAVTYFTVNHLTMKELKRIFSKIRVSTTHFYKGSPCWEWQGTKNRKYGHMSWRGKHGIRVHRILLAWFTGEPLPNHTFRGKQEDDRGTDHLCQNHPCCN